MLAQLRSALIASGIDVSEIILEGSKSLDQGEGAKAGGVKQISELIVHLKDGSVRRYVLKRVHEDGVRVKEGEGVITLYRLGRFDPAVTSVWTFDSFDSASSVGIGEPRELVVLEPRHESPLLAALLVAGRTPCNHTELGRALGKFLNQRHEPVEISLDQYVRELIGGMFGLMATLDAYPDDELNTEEYQAALEFAVRWTTRLMRGRATRIHGDFHPWNVFVDPGTLRVAVTGGLHTSYGLPEDDIACMGLNLFLSGSGKEVLEGLLEVYDVKSELFGFFLGWRLLVLANPLHYPARDPNDRRRLRRAALFALAGENLPKQLSEILDLLLGSADPWIRIDGSAMSRHGNLSYASPDGRERQLTRSDLVQSEGATICLAGRVVALRKMKRTLFADVQSRDQIQVAIPRERRFQEPDFDLRPWDLVGVSGRVERTRSGELSVLAEDIRWWHPCLLSAQQAQAELQGMLLYEATARLLSRVRTILENAGFHELITSTLKSSFEGGRARPFVTWSHDRASRLFLRVTAELALKGAVARGTERVYEIGAMFRNEAEDGRHLPEFLMLEAYAAYMDLDEALDLVASLLRDLGDVAGLSTIRRMRFPEVFKEDIDLDVADSEAVAHYCAERGIAWPTDDDGRIGAMHSILRRHVAPLTSGILIVSDLPEGRSPLSYSRNRTYSRAWVFVHGTSVADVAVEEPSLEVVRRRLDAQFKQDRYLVKRDYRSFLNTLALGVPPCIGIGMSLSRLLQVVMGAASIRETKLLS